MNQAVLLVHLSNPFQVMLLDFQLTQLTKYHQQIACLPSDTTHTVQATQFVFQVTQLAYQVISQLDKITVSLEKPLHSLLIK